jgi:RNA polymerase sigma-70 factor (ECF subfamily)
MYREHYQLIYRTAYHLTGSAEDAEDVLQSIFLRLLRNDFPADIERNAKGYFYRAAVNASLDTIRNRRRQVPLEDVEVLLSLPNVSNDGFEEELHRRLLDAIAELRPKAAHILVLRYVHNYSDTEIGKLLGTSRGTIAVSLYRSRARLKKLIRAALGETR